MNETRWEAHPIDEREVDYLAKGLQTSIKTPGFPLRPLSRLLNSIGIKHPADALAFLKPSVAHLHNPFLMLDMKRAVDRILYAIDNHQTILFHGDYDCDGVTTTAVAVDVLRKHFGANVDFYVPHRHRDGYGLNIENLEPFARKYDLIISGDTGIKEFDQAARVKEMGLADLIITDHHEPLILPNDEMDKLPKNAVIQTFDHESIALPDAYAVVNPHRLGDPYPNNALSGVAVIFKVMQALFITRNKPMNELYHYLDYVATGLVADLVPQIDVHTSLHGVLMDMEVRSMTYLGLRIMNDHPKPWVEGMRKAAGIEKTIDAGDLGFKIGPRLNAPGRLDDPTPAVDLLLEDDHEQAILKAEALNAINTARKDLQTEASDAVLASFAEKENEWYDYACVARMVSPEHHSGIAGLVASTLQDTYYRTSIVLAEKQEKDGTTVLTGSARSIPGVSVIDCLKRTQDAIGPFRHGGHPQAAGLTLVASEGKTLDERFEEFRRAFRESVMVYDADVFKVLKTYNAEIDLSDVTFDLVSGLSHFEPFGTGNKEPIFCAKGVDIIGIPDPLSNGKHAKLTLSQHDSKPLKALLWGRGEEIMDWYESLIMKGDPPVLDILFKVSVNQYGNRPPEVQLIIEDYRQSTT